MGLRYSRLFHSDKWFVVGMKFEYRILLVLGLAVRAVPLVMTFPLTDGTKSFLCLLSFLGRWWFNSIVHLEQVVSLGNWENEGRRTDT